MIIFKESIGPRWQTIMFCLAMFGVIILAVNTGGIPLVSLTLPLALFMEHSKKWLMLVP
ncbi:hypothetical protein KHA80_00505 [Anaerobacillus sp. HL2]|nr:hypothetical protein KHA80_00505 [Anaerobacillus sp. HL2]